MKISAIFNRIGSWLFVFLGIGHLITYFFAPKMLEQINMIKAMKTFTINIAGTHTNLFMFYEGFSAAMGTLLFAFGSTNLLLDSHKIPARILYFNAFIALIILILSLTYFSLSLSYSQPLLPLPS